jgi:hypothetical protein
MSDDPPDARLVLHVRVPAHAGFRQLSVGCLAPIGIMGCVGRITVSTEMPYTTCPCCGAEYVWRDGALRLLLDASVTNPPTR